MPPTIPHPSEPRNDPHGDRPDDLRRGAKLLAGAVDPEKVLAFASLIEVEQALDGSLESYAAALGHAARVLGLTLAETLTLVDFKVTATRLLAEHFALAALASTERRDW